MVLYQPGCQQGATPACCQNCLFLSTAAAAGEAGGRGRRGGAREPTQKGSPRSFTPSYPLPLPGSFRRSRATYPNGTRALPLPGERSAPAFLLAPRRFLKAIPPAGGLQLAGGSAPQAGAGKGQNPPFPLGQRLSGEKRSGRRCFPPPAGLVARFGWEQAGSGRAWTRESLVPGRGEGAHILPLQSCSAPRQPPDAGPARGPAGLPGCGAGGVGSAQRGAESASLPFPLSQQLISGMGVRAALPR